MTDVSVIVPCYNYARFLEDCLDSVLTQRDVDVRVLVVDDCSDDETPEVGAAYARRDPRVEFRRHAVNAGNIATYNEGLDWADGRYTLLLSADDLLTAGCLQRAVRFLDRHPDAGLVYGARIRYFSDESLPAARDDSSEPTGRVVQGAEWIARVCQKTYPPISSPEVIVRTDLQHELGGYSTDLPHTADLELWLRFAARSNIGVLDDDQAYYRTHSNNMRQGMAEKLNEFEVKRAAFDSFFAHHAEDLPDAKLLQRTANRALARNAFWASSLALRGRTKGERIAPLLTFAAAVVAGQESQGVQTKELVTRLRVLRLAPFAMEALWVWPRAHLRAGSKVGRKQAQT